MRNTSLVRLGVALLLAALCLQVLASITTTSPTFDEPYHILRSYVYLKTGDRALLAQGGHPPWSNMISVAPLLLRSDVVLPPHQPGWPTVTQFKDLFSVADEFLWRVGNDAEGIVLWSRLPALLLSTLLAALVFLWARQLLAPRAGHLAAASAGLLALLLYAFDPNLIAHTGVVTTDLGATFFIFLSIYCLWRFCRQPSWGRLTLTGVAVGLAQATKFSSLFLAPIFLVLLTLWVLDRPDHPSSFALPGERRVASRLWQQRAYRLLGLCVVIFGLALLVLWAVYGFEVGRLLPHEDSHPVLDRLLPLDNALLKRLAYGLAEGLPLPAPSYFADLAWLQRYADAGHPSFLLGSYGVQGWWYYFPVAFLIKTPIPLLLLLLAAAYLSLRHPRREQWRDEAFLLVPAALFFISSMFSSIDIGYRNILPVLPFTFVYVSKVGAFFAGRLQRILLVLLCSWYVLGTVALGPHYLAHFNEFVGGPDNGYKYLVDSNLDWGQDLKNLREYMETQGISEVYLSYFGTADPAYYGIRFQPMPDMPPSADAASAYYAISATSLQNVYSRSDKSGPGGPLSVGHWLSSYQPIGKAGYSIFVYRLP